MKSSQFKLLDMSPSSKRREMNKIYCKNHRRKGKQYVKTLEDKIESLEKQVAELQEQLAMTRVQ